MGEYRDDWFSFEIKSRRHILDVIIEPSFAKAVCFQVHELKNNSFQLFWNFGMVGREMYSALMEYVKVNKINPNALITEVCSSEKFADFMRANAPEIFIADLDADDMALVNAVVHANWSDKEYRGGLDGHSYKIKIYGESVREFKCWCELEPQRIHYEVHGVY